MFSFKEGSTAVAVTGCVCAAGLYLYSLGLTSNTQVAQVVALLIGGISLYASGAIPGFVTSLLIFLVSLVGNLAPVEVIFSGFSSGGAWLLLSGIIIGVAARETGLGEYIANWLVINFRLNFVRAIFILTCTAVLLGFLVPAVIPRILILMPLAMGFADALGYEPGSRGYTGIALSVAAGSFFPPLSILTATLPSVVFAGGIEASFGQAPSYAQFLTYHFPVTGTVRWLGLICLLIIFFREPASNQLVDSSGAQLAPAQRRLIGILCIAVAFWMTDAIHNIPPAAVGLGAAILILMPRVGVLNYTAFLKQADLTPFIFVAGIISLGAIVTNSSVDELIGTNLGMLFSLETDSQFATYLKIAMLSSLACAVLTIPAAPILLVPLAEQFSSVGGLGMQATLMTEYLGMTNILFPYQAPPLIVALSLFSISALDQMKILFCLFLLTVIVVFPLNFLWWKAIGLI